MKKGNQRPRICVEPPRATTDGKGAAMLMDAYGLQLDKWQQLVLNCWLGKDENGDYSATSAGLCVPRQNGKNVIVEAREFYGLIINGEKILHTAHQLRTAKKSFRRLVAMFTDKNHPEVCKTVQQIRYGLGEESITLNNGGMIEFTSRSKQAARGYAGISLVVYDEAQDLTDDQAEALMAVLSASDTGTRQLIYTGTPCYVGCTGTVFRRLRQACMEQKADNTAWHEWGIDGKLSDYDLSDKRLWYLANPALGYRLTEEFTAHELATLSPLGFARERLGWWTPEQEAQEAAAPAIDPEVWAACRSTEGRPEGKTAYGVKFSADGSCVVLAGAILPATGKGRIAIIEAQPMGQGLSWLAAWLNERYRQASCVVIDGRNGADVLVEKLRPAGGGAWAFKDSVIRASAPNVVAAASLLINELQERTVTWYAGQEALNASALAATKRKVGSGWGFGGEDCELLEACALALWGCKTSKRNPQKKMRIG